MCVETDLKLPVPVKSNALKNLVLAEVLEISKPKLRKLPSALIN